VLSDDVRRSRSSSTVTAIHCQHNIVCKALLTNQLRKTGTESCRSMVVNWLRQLCYRAPAVRAVLFGIV
jgi:hypothetical protein